MQEKMTSFTIVVETMHTELQKKRRTCRKLLKQHAGIKVKRREGGRGVIIIFIIMIIFIVNIIL